MAKILNIEQVMLGDEPAGELLNHAKETYTLDLMKCLNWYNYDHGQVQAKKMTVDFMKKNAYNKEQIKHVDGINDKKFNQTHSFLLRLRQRGASLAPLHHEVTENYIKSLLNYTEPPKIVIDEEDKPKKPTVQELLAEKINDFIGELEGIIDDFIYQNKEYSLYNALKFGQLPAQYAKPIIEWAEAKLEEPRAAQRGKDKELVEGWSNFTAAKQKKYIGFLESMIADANKFADFKKANRKIPVRKTKPAGEIVAKMKFKKEDTTFNIKSISVPGIVGAESVWVFNTKNKKLGVYYASGPSGLSVKGTTIINYDPETSIQKTIRKPEEILKKCLDGGKLVLRKLLSDVNAKESQLNGRTNEDTIILRII